VLVGCGGHTFDHGGDRIALAIPGVNLNLTVAPHLTSEIRHTQTTFIINECLVAGRCQYRVDQNGQGNIGSIGITGVITYFYSTDPQRLINLVGSEPRTPGSAFGSVDVTRGVRSGQFARDGA